MRARGFTLVELLVGMVILAILMMLALPTFQDFRANSRIRNTADSLAQGARLAQVEAIRRNRPVEFIVDPAVGWTINDPDPVVGGPVQAEPFSDTGGTVTVDTNPPGAVRIAYDSLGQFLQAPTPILPLLVAPDPVTFINVTSIAVAAPRDLRVILDPTLGIGVRVCDPEFTDLADPKTGTIACP